VTHRSTNSSEIVESAMLRRVVSPLGGRVLECAVVEVRVQMRDPGLPPYSDDGKPAVVAPGFPAAAGGTTGHPRFSVSQLPRDVGHPPTEGDEMELPALLESAQSGRHAISL
jgi:hypothetical protein